MAPSAARLGTLAAAASGGGVSSPIGAGGGASAPAGVDRLTLGRNRSPPLVLTMFGGGADREWVPTATGPQGRCAQDEFKKKMKMKRRRGKGLKRRIGQTKRLLVQPFNAGRRRGF